jgi:hypothetical protein
MTNIVQPVDSQPKPIQINANNLNIEIKNSSDKSIFFKFFCCHFEKEGNSQESDKSDDYSHTCCVCRSNKSLITQIKHSRYFKSSYYKNNSSYFIFILLYIILQVFLVVIQLHVYRDSNGAILVARACGILLNFNMGFVLILVLRGLITWLRGTSIGRKCLPSDDFLGFHKAIGLFILILSVLHTLGHCINLCKYFI